ncbi:MAG: hypothetical protein KAR20_04795, partial [Candidatus Heimdallarchaeota archaeon]|nr:hypothetical protein [Candidatus Heimdallarchaeota archaeon]
KKILTAGDDYSKIFQAASVRSDIKQKISELTELIEKALIPIKNLEKLTLEGRKLTSGNSQLQTTHSDSE